MLPDLPFPFTKDFQATAINLQVFDGATTGRPDFHRDGLGPLFYNAPARNGIPIR